jgi:hypothetical protein
MVPEAIKTLSEVVVNGDDEDQVRLKAAMTVLDRTGFGTHSTITLEDERADLSQLTPDQLVARAAKIGEYLRQRNPEGQQIDPNQSVH